MTIDQIKREMELLTRDIRTAGQDLGTAKDRVRTAERELDTAKDRVRLLETKIRDSERELGRLKSDLERAEIAEKRRQAADQKK